MPAGRAEVVAVWDEGPLMCGLRLGSMPPYRAGQAIKISHGGSSAVFALATAHGRDRAPELLLRRGGGVADALIADARPGLALDYDGPLGPGFPLEPALGRDVLLVAVGSGLSSIRAVLETLLDERERYGRVTLIYGQERASEFAYAEARATWIAAGVEVILCAHAPDADWTGERGFVQDALMMRAPQIDLTTAVAYLCGMPGMIAGVREVLAPQGLPPERTYLNL